MADGNTVVPLAGDMPDLHGLHLERMDHDALSGVQLGFIEHGAMRRIIDERRTVDHVLWRETLVDAAMYREWIVSLGTRSAAARMAHLLSELRERLDAIGRVADDQFSFPITRSKLAETLGISTVHVNRVLQSFRSEGVLDIQRQIMTLRDIEKIVEIGGFNDLYLHHQQGVRNDAA